MQQLIKPYTSAILATQYGWPLWVNLPLGMLVAGVVALPVALVALRTVEDYFIICTMGMGVILFSLMNNWMDLTRGPMGIPGIPAVSLFGHALTAKWEWVLLAAFFYMPLYKAPQVSFECLKCCFCGSGLLAAIGLIAAGRPLPQEVHPVHPVVQAGLCIEAYSFMRWCFGWRTTSNSRRWGGFWWVSARTRFSARAWARTWGWPSCNPSS